MTDHAEIIARAIWNIWGHDDNHDMAQVILLDLAAAGVLLTDPEKGDVIVRPNYQSAANSDAISSWDFSRARVLPCPTCHGLQSIQVQRRNPLTGEPQIVKPCPDCSDYTLGRTNMSTRDPHDYAVLVAPYRLPSPGPNQ